MNITSTVCWCNIWDKDTIVNVGPDVLCLRNGNIIKFINMQTLAVSYFKPETVATGLSISVFTGHNRFPLFAFAEVVLRGQIFVYRYPDFTKFSVIPKQMISYSDIKFSEFDMLVGVGGHPNFPLVVFNYRTSAMILRHNTRVSTVPRGIVVSCNTLPSIVLFHKRDMTVLNYEICTLEKESSLHKVVNLEIGNDFIRSVVNDRFVTFADDDHLYVVNDYGTMFLIELAGFALKPQWYPKKEPDQITVARVHSLASHRGGLVIYNNSHAFFVKKKSGSFQTEWALETNLQDIVRFISNMNGELYAERRPGSIDQLVVDKSGTVGLECVVPTGQPVIAFRVLPGLKEESVCVLHNDRLAMLDLAKGHTLSEVMVPRACAMANHRSLAIVAVGTVESRILLIQFERATVANVLFDLQMDTPGVMDLDFNDNWLVFQDQSRTLQVVQVETRPYKLMHYFEMELPELKKVFVHTFLLADGPRLMVFIHRERHTKRPGTAGELWLFTWGKDRRLHRREYVLPKEYNFFCVQPPMGRWALIEIVASVHNTFNFDQFTLNERDEVQWVASTKSAHYSYILGMSMTKNLVTWSLGGVLVHFKQHKRSKKPFMVSRFLNIGMQAEYFLRVKECFNAKYLIILLADRRMRVTRLPSLADSVQENTALPLPTEEGVPLYIDQTIHKVDMFVPLSMRQEVKEEYSQAELLKQERMFKMIKRFSAKVTDLIDYDISKTGKTKGIFKKFCFHYPWLDRLTEEAHKLCALERASLEEAIADQARIRDWIMRLVTRDAVSINYRVRSIFADANFESFAFRRKLEMAEFDRYRFYDLEDHIRLSQVSLVEEEFQPPAAQTQGHGPSTGKEDTELGEEEEEAGPAGLKELKPFVVEGPSVYEHMMAPVFQLQDRNMVTSNQVFNYNCKMRYYLSDPLKQEFNKLFHEAQQLKRATIESVVNTNAVLYKIYDNMNIMLRLLNMDQFEKPDLTVPSLEQDEVIERIMEVDDSEIKAINRRKPKTIDTGGKKGRLLLWSVEFWSRALIVMMDGVLEKLWEEEIKKNIPEPEFMAKKQPHEYNLEEQKIFRAYEEAVRLLELDRRKYLRILHENEEKTLALKASQILKLNQRVAELMILKLRYDFALKQGQVRLLTLEKINFNRVQLRKRIGMFSRDVEKLSDLITRFSELLEFWEKSVGDIRTRLEAQQTRDRAVERHFRANFLPTVPHATHEMTKLFKKRPKLPTKIFNSVLICMEASNKLSGKPSQRTPFPLPPDVHDFLNHLAEFDQPKHCPPQVDLKSWETFVKLRRQKMETEMRLKGIGYQLLDGQTFCFLLQDGISTLREAKVETQYNCDESVQQYLESMRNMTLQVTLTMGQVEVSVMGEFTNLSNTVLMHMDDINEVNRQIREAGNMKIRAMERVAIFRRQVIFKEWEHKLYKANIAYLKYMLDAIERCKVTVEFLNILRNWEKVKNERQKYIAGAIERVIEQKIAAFRKQIERVNLKIDTVKAQTLEVKQSSHAIDFKIERIKVDVTLQNSLRDTMMEEKRDREQRERMSQIKTHRQLMENVRRHYAHVLELQTILELLRLRTYPTLGPPLPQCHPPVPEHILGSVP